MTSLSYNEYCRVTAFLNACRKEDLQALDHAVMTTLVDEKNLYFRQTLERLHQEIGGVFEKHVD